MNWHWFLVVVAVLALPTGRAFRPPTRIVGTSGKVATPLSMGKGLNKVKNKQLDLKRKLELAKEQNKDDDEEGGGTAGTRTAKVRSAQEIQTENDRKRFAELLQREGSKVLNDYTSDSYLNTKQEEEEITAARAGVDRIFEGDPAPTDCFENLISIVTEKMLAHKGAARLVPWIGGQGLDPDDYRIIVCDPRKQSDQLHQTIRDLSVGLPPDLRERLVFINADTPAENRRWMKKNGLLVNDNNPTVKVYSDSEDLDWMKAYTALGDQRWSMTMFIICRGRVVKLARELDVYNASRTVINAVKAMKSEQR